LAGEEIVSSEFHGCQFRDCSFVEASFINCKFSDCQFLHCDLSMIKLEGTALLGVKFKKSKLIGIDWTTADWPDISIREPLAFDGCILNHATFIGLNMKGVRFVRCTARDVDFRETDLSGAAFVDTDLAQSLFLHTKLKGADFRTGRNYEINPSLNNIEGAKFSFPEAMSLLYNLNIILEDQTTDEPSG
jgi:uncharacterized protein YjbI with pentapeptide repeats